MIPIAVVTATSPVRMNTRTGRKVIRVIRFIWFTRVLTAAVPAFSFVRMYIRKRRKEEGEGRGKGGGEQ